MHDAHCSHSTVWSNDLNLLLGKKAGYKEGFSGLVGIYFKGSSCLTSQLLPAPVPLSFNNQHSRGGNYLSGPDIQVILS